MSTLGTASKDDDDILRLTAATFGTGKKTTV